MSHNPRHPYDEANDIINREFPSLGAANAIIRDAFPAAAEADRILADSGLIPRRGRGGIFFEGGGPEGLTAGTAGGISLPPLQPGERRQTGPRSWEYRGVRGPLPPGTRSGPGRYTGPHRRAPSIVGGLIRKDTSGTVDINRWSARMKAHGVPGEWILDAYETAGGSADLSAEERAGNTQDFLGDFVEALVDLGADPDVLLVSYQEAGGRIGKDPR